nr:MAG TPA: hypothetical protein [Caudoviricetes sp.]DAX85014.1 MAG TPA: hypothetical protein [Caudoviricetes sp.]
MRKFWKEVHYFEVIETYSHNFIVNWFNVFDLRFVLNWGRNRIYSHRLDFLLSRSVH